MAGRKTTALKATSALAEMLTHPGLWEDDRRKLEAALAVAHKEATR